MTQPAEARLLRAMYEAWGWIDLDLERNLAQGRGSVARLKLARALEEAAYEPYLADPKREEK